MKLRNLLLIGILTLGFTGANLAMEDIEDQKNEKEEVKLTGWAGKLKELNLHHNDDKIKHKLQTAYRNGAIPSDLFPEVGNEKIPTKWSSFEEMGNDEKINGKAIKEILTEFKHKTWSNKTCFEYFIDEFYPKEEDQKFLKSMIDSEHWWIPLAFENHIQGLIGFLKEQKNLVENTKQLRGISSKETDFKHQMELVNALGLKLDEEKEKTSSKEKEEKKKEVIEEVIEEEKN